MWRSIATGLVLLLLLGERCAVADPRHHVVDTIAVQPDGSVTWNLLPLKNDRELLERLKRARAAKAEIKITASPNARFEAVGHVVAILQRAGMAKIGFLTVLR